MKRILSLTLLAAIAPGAALADALPYPAMEGPLTANADPWSVDMGPLGKIHFGGAISGLALTQDNPAPGDRHALTDLGNAQLFIAKTDGWFQVFVQAGGYSLPALRTA